MHMTIQAKCPIAILMATYNGENYIREMLDSLLAQTFSDFVCYVHDDGSSDGTMEIVREYAMTYPEKFQVISGPSQGSAKKNFLWMLSLVEAECYMFADQDDVWLPDKIARSYQAFLDGTKDYRCVFTDMYVTDACLHVISDSMIRYIGRDLGRTGYTQMSIDNPAAGCTMMFDRKLRDKAIQIRHMDSIEMHDHWELMLAVVFGQVIPVDEPLVYYRQHGTNEMGAVTETTAQKICRNLKEVFSGKFAAEKREFIRQGRRLAEEVLLLSDIPEEKRQVLQEYAAIASQSRIRRIRFYREHDCSRNGKGSTLWMWLWV